MIPISSILVELDRLAIQGTDPNLTTDDNTRRTALHILMGKIRFFTLVEDFLLVVRRLVHHGANLNLQDSSGKTAVHIVMDKIDSFSSERILPVVDTLLELGAPLTVNVQDILGWTACHVLIDKVGLACPHPSQILPYINVLLKHDTDQNLQDNEGRTVLHILMIDKAGRYHPNDIIPLVDELAVHASQENLQISRNILMEKIEDLCDPDEIMPIVTRLDQHIRAQLQNR